MTKPASQARIGEIEARLAEATPTVGEFRVNHAQDVHETHSEINIVASIGTGYLCTLHDNQSIAELFAHAHSDIGYLLDQVAALTASRERLREALECYSSCYNCGSENRRCTANHSDAIAALTADDEALRE